MFAMLAALSCNVPPSPFVRVRAGCGSGGLDPDQLFLFSL
jgi:hypothetical protein